MNIPECAIAGCGRARLVYSEFCVTCDRAFSRGRAFELTPEPPFNSVWLDRSGVAWIRTAAPGLQRWASGALDQLGLNWSQVRCRGGELLRYGTAAF